MEPFHPPPSRLGIQGWSAPALQQTSKKQSKAGTKMTETETETLQRNKIVNDSRPISTSTLYTHYLQHAKNTVRNGIMYKTVLILILILFYYRHTSDNSLIWFVRRLCLISTPHFTNLISGVAGDKDKGTGGSCPPFLLWRRPWWNIGSPDNGPHILNRLEVIADIHHLVLETVTLRFWAPSENLEVT